MPGVRPPAKCGTDGGYFRHIRTLREPACDECKAAHAEYQRMTYRVEKIRKGVAA